MTQKNTQRLKEDGGNFERENRNDEMKRDRQKQSEETERSKYER